MSNFNGLRHGRYSPRLYALMAALATDRAFSYIIPPNLRRLTRLLEKRRTRLQANSERRDATRREAIKRNRPQ
jgi:hypothetical protein